MTRTAPAQRSTTRIGVAEGLVLLAGLYLIVVPFVVGYEGLGQLVFSDVVVGLALSLLAVAHALAFDRVRGLSWVVPVLGAWVVVSPLAMGHQGEPPATPAAWLHNSIAGGVVLVAGLVIAVAALRRSARDGAG
ncbi:MAG TPA: SPW repeat protein [Pseudonocardiaceae bacterium]|jgi:hypothetical protein|nr:SPW repeat protein [Pseudonocardiaceae bacterium]